MARLLDVTPDFDALAPLWSNSYRCSSHVITHCYAGLLAQDGPLSLLVQTATGEPDQLGAQKRLVIAIQKRLNISSVTLCETAVGRHREGIGRWC